MRRAITILIVGLAFAPGCLAKQLRVPAEDHYVQTKVISDRCQKDPACSDEHRENYAETAKQACAIDAIVKGKDPAHCERPDEASE